MSEFRFKGQSHTTVKIGPEAVLVKHNGTVTVPDTRDGQFKSPTWEKIIKKVVNIKKAPKKKDGEK